MRWLYVHRYAVLFSTAALVLLFIAGATSQTRVSSQGSPVVAISAGDVSSAVDQTAATQPPPNTPAAPVQQNNAISFNVNMPPTEHPATSSPTRPSAPLSPSTAPQRPNDTQLPAAQAPAADTASGSSLLTFAYSLTPSNALVASAPQAPVGRTPDQQALYEYGNRAGDVISTFENSSSNVPKTMQNWINDRTDQAAQSAVRQVAGSMTAAGTALARIANVPQSAQAQNNALAASFQSAATGLANVVEASASDTALVESMKSYDATVASFTKSYLALVDVFTLHEVTFSASDPGSVFTFPQ